jgi:hypothetical protein
VRDPIVQPQDLVDGKERQQRGERHHERGPDARTPQHAPSGERRARKRDIAHQPEDAAVPAGVQRPGPEAEAVVGKLRDGSG